MIWGGVILASVLTGISLWLRVAGYRALAHGDGVENKTSPLSRAIQDLVATAGGIYLAVIALTSFLRLDIPDKVTVFSVAMDPLAVSALSAAVIQPFIVRLFNK